MAQPRRTFEYDSVKVNKSVHVVELDVDLQVYLCDIESSQWETDTMDVYMYRAALLCAEHGEQVRQQLTAAGKAPADPSEEHTYDSDEFPKGPYPDGGGEADTPQHCDICGTFLENILTPDGDAYVREQAEPFTYPDDDGDVAPWALVAERADDARQPALGDWIRFYFAPGL
jgi:hypothetical protein